MRSHDRFPPLVGAVLLLALTPAAVSVAAGASWLDPAWGYRIPVTVDPAQIQGGGGFQDFPILIRPGAAEGALYLHAKADGSDLVVTKADGTTVLAREIVSFDPAAKRAEIWLRADTLSTADNTFYIYYGNPDTTLAGDDGSAWRSAYLGVYHFAEDPGLGILKDHGPHGDDATTGAGSAFTSQDTISGPVGQAWKFNGTTHWVDGDAISSADSSFTISAWFGCWNWTRPDDADFAFSVENPFWHLSAKRNNSQLAPDFAVSGQTMAWNPYPLPDTLAHHYVWTLDGDADTLRFYYDGQEQTAWLHYTSLAGGKVYTGMPIQGNVGIASPAFGSVNPYDLMEGVVDEFRVMEGVVGPDWVATEYRTEASPDFLAYGSEEPYGTTAVNLLWFRAERDPGGARIWWQTPSDAPDTPIAIYRGDAGDRVRITSSPLWTNRQNSFLDTGAPATAVSYWLADLSRSGATSWVGPVTLAAAGTRGVAAVLEQNRPNPFRADTRIRFTARGRERVRLSVFDAQGRRVAVLLDGIPSAGEHDILWRGEDDRGRHLSPGIYFYRLETATGSMSRRMVLVP